MTVKCFQTYFNYCIDIMKGREWLKNVQYFFLILETNIFYENIFFVLVKISRITQVVYIGNRI